MQTFLSFIANNLPLLLAMIVGIGLLVIEVFLPGFGVPGLMGGMLMIASIVIVWTNYGAMAGIWMTLAAVVLMSIAITVSLRSASKGGFFRRWGLKDIEKKMANEDMQSLVGKSGVSITPLRPSGIGEFDGVRLDVVTDGQFVPIGTALTIVKAEGPRIVVSPAKQPSCTDPD